MSNKITCTCGHSWNKSDSSKKDVTVCHICGKDNIMQLGGFVYPVNYVPQKKNGGWLDAYDENVPEAQNGIEGTMGGLTDKGFNYNGAWGGQFQDGGNSLELAKMRSKMALAAAFGNPSAKRMTSVSPSSYTFTGNEMIDGKSEGVRPGETGTHYMSSMGEYAVPYIQEGPNGKLRFNSNASFRDKEAIRFDNPKDARYFAEHYKEVAPMMRNYAMGGSLPGSVGFTYARTGDIPSNGPYAKKTMASAQNGKDLDLRSAPEYLNSYITSPEFKKRFKGIDTDYKKSQKQAKDAFTNYKPYVLEKDPINDEIGSRVGFPELNKLAGAPVNATVLLSRPQAKRINGDLSNDILPHEYAHIARGNLDFSDELNFAFSNKNPKSQKDFQEWQNETLHPKKGRSAPSSYSLWLKNYKGEHDAAPDENYADLSALRYMMYKQGIYDTRKGPMTEEHFKKAQKDPFIQKQFNYKRLMKTFKPKDIINLNNTVAMNDSNESQIAQNGMEMKFYQEGLDWTPKNISRDGSEIKKDDMGYWNPENWGKPVEIGSNNITMKGLQEMGYNNPLLGISDTGDTQMMYPGEDYTFDGESVTEYPVMQKGGRTPIYTENPKDKRIKAYQDSLSLYNQTLGNLKAFKKDLGWQHDDATLKSSIRKYWPNAIAHMKASSKATEWYASDEENNDPTGTRESAYSTSGYKNKVIPTILPVDYYAPQWSDNAFSRIPRYKKPVQPVVYKKPEPTYVEKFGLTNEDIKSAFATKPIIKKGGDVYYDINKGGKKFKVHTQSGGIDYIEEITPLKPSIKLQPKQEPTTPPIKKIEQPKPIERKQNIYEGSPVYSPGAGTGMGSALVGFLGQQGDTTYIKPEDYERFAVPKYGKEFIESKTKKKKNGGWLEKYK